MKKHMLAAIASGVALAFGATTSATLAALADAGHSQVRFVAKQSEVDLSGGFQRFTAQIDLDPAAPQSGKVKVSIELDSADAGGADANNLLRSKEFFDVAHFPVATFEATSITPAPNGGFQASGPFTLKGHSANVVIPFAVRREGAAVWFEGSTTISRLAFHVGEGQWADTGSLDDEVLIQFKVQSAH